MVLEATSVLGKVKLGTRNQRFHKLLPISSSYTFGFTNFSADFVRRPETIEFSRNQLIDFNNRQEGISKSLFSKIMNSLRSDSESKFVNNLELQMYATCFSPNDCMPSERLQILEQLWEKLESSGKEPTTKMMNIKLLSYVRNHKDFSPTEQLESFKEKNLEPNSMTLMLFLEAFCEKGDVAGANIVLDQMKDFGMHLSTKIFSHLISCHLKAGLEKEAEDVLEIIAQRKLKPTHHTFFVFANHYAKLGDLESVNKYIQKVEESPAIYFENSQLAELYINLVLSGNKDKAEEFWNNHDLSTTRPQKVNDLLQRLLSQGHEEETLQLYSKLSYNEATIIFFIKSLVNCQLDPTRVYSFLSELPGDHVLSNIHRTALFQSYGNKTIDWSLRWLEILKEKNELVKLTMVLPAVAYCIQTQDTERLIRALQIFLSCDVDVSDKLLSLYDYQAAMEKMNLSQEDLIAKTGHEDIWNWIFLKKAFLENGLKALEEYEDKLLNENGFPSLFSFMPDFISLKSLEDIIDLAEILTRKVKKHEIYVLLTRQMMKIDPNLDDLLDTFLDKLAEKDLKILNFGIEDSPHKSKYSKEQLQKMQNLLPKWIAGRYESIEDLHNKSLDELKHLSERNKSFPVQHVYFLKLLDDPDVKEIEKMLQEFKSAERTLPYRTLYKTVDCLDKFERVDTIFDFYNYLVASCRKLPPSFYFRCAAVGLKAGREEEALEIIRSAEKSEFIERDNFSMHTISMLAASCKSTDAHEKLIDVFRETKFENYRNVLIAKYVNYLIQNTESDDQLITKLENVYKKYKRLPSLQAILIHFIQKKDVALFRKIMEIVSLSYAHNYLHTVLAGCFIQCDLPSKAYAILETQGRAINDRKLLMIGENLLEGGNIEQLETLVNMSKSLPVNKDEFFDLMLQAHISSGNLTKATEYLMEYEERFIHPNRKIAKQLASALISKGMEVPQQLQNSLKKQNDVEESSSSSSDSSSDSEPEKLRR